MTEPQRPPLDHEEFGEEFAGGFAGAGTRAGAGRKMDEDAGALIGALLDSCCGHVLETMFFSAVLEPVPASGGVGRARVATRLHFHGKPSGDLEIDADPEAARRLAENFLGVDSGALSGIEIDQVMAELANMTCGSALSSLGRVEYFHLETPATTRPSEYAPAIEGVRRGFLLDGGTLAVCLRVDFGDDSESGGEPAGSEPMAEAERKA